MDKLYKIFLFFIAAIYICPVVWAGEALERRRELLEQQRQEYYQTAQKKSIEQQRLAYQIAAQQLAVQQQAKQQALYQQAFQEKQINSYQEAYKQSLKQLQEHQLELNKIAQMQAYEIEKQQQIAMQQQLRLKSEEYQVQQQKEIENQRANRVEGNVQDSFVSENYNTIEVAQESSFADILAELEISAEVWPLIIDQYPKEMAVQEYIDWYQSQGISIRKPSRIYVSIIDKIPKDNPALLKQPLKDVLKIAAIIEYDFDNGQNKDQMAAAILSEEAFLNNKKRLGL